MVDAMMPVEGEALLGWVISLPALAVEEDTGCEAVRVMSDMVLDDEGTG